MATKTTTQKKKYVPHILPIDDNLNQDDVIVVDNFKTYRLQRGVPLMLPESVYNILMESMASDREKLDYIKQAQKKAEEMKNKNL